MKHIVLFFHRHKTEEYIFSCFNFNKKMTFSKNVFRFQKPNFSKTKIWFLFQPEMDFRFNRKLFFQQLMALPVQAAMFASRKASETVWKWQVNENEILNLKLNEMFIKMKLISISINT